VLVLALDTSSQATTVAVVRDGAVLADQTEVAANRHGEVLAPMVDTVLRAADVSSADVDAVGVGVGPGPFTGLRVGIVTALSLGDAIGVPVRGVCSLDAVAHAAGRPWESGFVVATDARRKEVYWAAYRDGARVIGPAVDHPAVLAARLDPGTALVGAGAVLYADAFAEGEVDAVSPYPSAAVVARLSVDPGWAVDPLPLYLRRPDARPPGAPKKVTPA